jgi:hypothetical protein
MKYILTIFIINFTINFFSQEINSNRKIYLTKRVFSPPKIDADLSDTTWENVSVAKDFIMFRPEYDKPEPKGKRTEVKIVYDDNAIYVGAYLYDDEPDKILREFQTRDNFGNADFFAITLNPLDDGINQFQFFVTSAGTQNDALVSSRGEDFSWNAVWNSSVKITDKGWIVEMKIPYSALRFPKQENQSWGLNFHRHFKRSRAQYSWNPINPTIGGVAQYDGLLKGLKNIEPPVRLSFNPFISGQITDYSNDTNFDWTAGLDVKYGINDSFTLDATIIPDFGQIGFDQVTLNLGPFEQNYSEKRAFFTEGTELFSKGNLFYSRRIGSSPIGRYSINLDGNEIIKENPSKVDVLNIIKVSGRTKKGLGIGVLNAITEKTYAIVKNTLTNQKRKVVTEPLANYNVLVIDQQFNKNSSISLINTNVMREGGFRDANVTSLLYDIKTKDSKYGVNGSLSISNIFENQNTKSGYQGSFELGKKSGKHRYSAGIEFMDDKYNKNDLGFQRSNNFLNYGVRYSYRIFKPRGIFNKYGFFSYLNFSYLFKMDKNWDSYIVRSKKHTATNFGFNFFSVTKKQLFFGGNFNTGIGPYFDYYEPQTFGRFYKSNSNFSSNLYISTDYTKKFAFDAGVYFGMEYSAPNKWVGFNVAPRFRFNNKFSMIYEFDYGIDVNEIGFVTNTGTDIIFGKRDSFTFENTLTGKYNFSTKAALSLSLRHFWSPVKYIDFYNLNLDGTLSNSTYSDNEDINFNTWDFNLKYNWEFAPGSQLVIFYRNNIFKYDNYYDSELISNMQNLFKQDLYQNFSVKLIYYIDYNNMKHWLKGS